MEVAELLNRLESNQPQIVEETKKIFHEHFNATKESWLVVGLFDYYLYTSSIRSVEILVGVREPHDKHLFDKILEALKGPSKLQALTLLGHVVRRQPTWLYKITQHPLMKELIKVLKTEIDIMPLMSALLVLIVLLPMLPALIGPFLPDIFEVFSRLAAWKCTNPNKLPEEHLLHLQVALYALFHRLYGMYPCNFLSYMRSEYSRHENLGTFSHTIKPMLDSVKMHPLLVTHSKEGETAAQRWKSMEHHDVILECAKFSLDTEHSTLRSRPALDLSHHAAADGFHHLAIAAQSPAADSDLWSPSVHCGLVTPPALETAATPIPQTPNAQGYVVASASLPHQEGTSPPEAAIEATPETTPIKDLRNVMGRPTPPMNSSVVRALNNFGGSKWPGVTSNSTTPSQSQPSSPMKKESFAFAFPSETSTPTSAFEQPRRDSLFQATDPRRDFLISQKVQKVLHERNQMTIDSPPIEKLAMNRRPRSSGAAPTSPLRVIGSAALCVPNSPVPMDPTAPVPGGKVSRPTPEKNGFRFDTPVVHDSTQEDREVFEIVRQGEQLLMESQPRPVPVASTAARQCDSVLHDIHGPHADDYEECPQDSGSPCTSGGLHMPNSRSMQDFARRVALQRRQRYYSQCVPDHAASSSAEAFSAGSSPGEGAAFAHVRRANSCPEMKKIPAFPAADIVKGKVLHEREELEMDDGHLTNGKGTIAPTRSKSVKKLLKAETTSASTQTIDYWAPFPYEHLFLEVLPSVEHNGDVKVMPYTVSSPAPLDRQQQQQRESPYAMLDKYIDTVAQPPHDGKRAKPGGGGGAETEARILREQIFLLNVQLQFERHRREVHAERNRRLLGKSRSTRAMEEHNMALREQLSLLQTDIEQLHIETDKKKREFEAKHVKFLENTAFWQHENNKLAKEVKELKVGRKVLELEVKGSRERTATAEKECQRAEKELLDAANEMRHAMSAASAGARLRSDVERLQKELLLMGELQQRYREQAAQRPLVPRHDEDEIAIVRDCGKAEITALSELLESKTSTLEASRARVIELESAVTRKDMLFAEQKRTLKLVKEEYHDQLEAVESKCETQRAINQRMEEQVMFLTNQLDELERGRIARSPDSSAHEASVSVSSAGSANRLLGLSPPLAESLRDRPQQWPGDAVGMKSLQLIAEQPEQQRQSYEPIGYAEPGASADS